MRRFIALAALVLIVLMLPMSVAATKTIKDQTISKGDHYSEYLLFVNKDDEIKMNLTANAPVDIYFITSAQFYNYPGNFTPQHSVLNTTSADFTWTQPDDSGYYLVVDNEFNNITGSADPTTTVTFTYSRSEPENANVEEAFNFLSNLCIGIAVVIIVIVVLIIVVIVVVSRRKKAAMPPPGSPVMTPGYGQAQPQYGAPQYGQPPPQQPYQPPPGQYQPPPPPPGQY